MMSPIPRMDGGITVGPMRILDLDLSRKWRTGGVVVPVDVPTVSDGDKHGMAGGDRRGRPGVHTGRPLDRGSFKADFGDFRRNVGKLDRGMPRLPASRAGAESFAGAAGGAGIKDGAWITPEPLGIAFNGRSTVANSRAQ